MDPDDWQVAADRILLTISENGFPHGDGENSFCCFISYRESANVAEAWNIYHYLTPRNIKCFLDKESLRYGERWKMGDHGFLMAINRSSLFLPLISRNAHTRVRDPSIDHSKDNVLVEYQAAIMRLDAAHISGDKFGILPILIGDFDRASQQLIKFNANPDHYPDSILPVEHQI